MTHTLPWQTPARNYYPLPKVLCRLGLSPGEIAVYSFLMYCENRATYQCYPSYRTIGEAVGKTLESVKLFDVYQGEQIEKGKKSVAFNIRMRAHDRTLTDDEADAAMKRVVKALDKMGISLRS